MSNFCADKDVVDFHDHTLAFGLKVNEMAFDARGVAPNPLASGALWTLNADLLALHRAVRTLCGDGWAFAAIMLLRSMLDILLNTSVIVIDRNNADYMGFKYLFFYLKKELADETLAAPSKAAYREQLDAILSKLGADDKERAKTFIFRDKMRGYWYSPEYASPSNILQKIATDDLAFLYDTYSAGVHGGYVGLRIFRDEPDQIHPNRRCDPRAQNAALLTSSRIVLEASRLRAMFEAPEGVKLYRGLMKEFQSMRDRFPLTP